jgi:hypothetical protein
MPQFPEFYEEEHTEVLARVAWARRRPSMLWIGGAGLWFTIAFAITLIEAPAAGLSSDTMQALSHEAAEIGRAVDSAARDARLRADRIAGTSMIRAAILTDAATVADVMASEFKLSLAKGEVIELFQIRNGSPELLIRMPHTAGELPRITDRERTMVHFDGVDLRAVVCAHIERLKDGLGYDAHTAGNFVLSAPIDLAAVRRRLAELEVDATLAESGIAVHLVQRSPIAVSEMVELPVPTKIAKLTLTVAPSAMSARRAPWVAPVRNASYVLGALCLIAFGAIFVLRRPR